MRWWVVALALMSACRGKKDVGDACENILDCERCVHGRCESGLPGAPCTESYTCDYRNDIYCVAGVCRGKGKRGEPCGACESGLTCHDNVCMNAQDLADADAKAVDAERMRKAEKERALLEQSGVTSKPEAEIAAAPPAGGSRVRTAKATAAGSAFAACKSDERLVGGGCQGGTGVRDSFPSGTSADDTVGARWNCTTSTGMDITAYALCAKVP